MDRERLISEALHFRLPRLNTTRRRQVADLTPPILRAYDYASVLNLADRIRVSVPPFQAAACVSRPRFSASAGSAPTMNAGFVMQRVSISSWLMPKAFM